MAFTGGINLGSSFNVQGQLPLDIRQKVADLTERDAIIPDVRWEGMRVYVVSEGKSYFLVGGIDNANWEEGGSGLGGGVGGTQWETDTSAPIAKKWNGLTAYGFPWSYLAAKAFTALIVPDSYEGQEITVKVPCVRTADDYASMAVTALLLLPDGTTKTETVSARVDDDGLDFNLVSFKLAGGGEVDGEPLVPGAVVLLTLKRSVPDALPWEASLFSGLTQDLDFISVGDTGCYVVNLSSKSIYWLTNVQYYSGSVTLPLQYITSSLTSKLGSDGIIVFGYGNDDTLKTYYASAGGSWTAGPFPTYSGMVASTDTVVLSLQSGGVPAGKTSYANAAAPSSWTTGYDFKAHTNNYYYFLAVKASSSTLAVAALGDNGAEILVSTDGHTWSLVDSGDIPFSASNFEYCFQVDGKFFIVESGVVYTSSDGETWTTHAGTGLPNPAVPAGVDYFDGKYYALYLNGVYSTANLESAWQFEEFNFVGGLSGIGHAGGGQIVTRGYDLGLASNSFIKVPATPNADDVIVPKNLISVAFTEPED